TNATATMAEPDYAGAFRTLSLRQRRRALVVMFTDVIDVRASRHILGMLTQRTRRHLPLLVALRNEEVIEAAIPRADEVGQTEHAQSPYTVTAAEELLGAREEALVAMRHAGVSVLDTPPDAVTAAVINRYLELKAR